MEPDTLADRLVDEDVRAPGEEDDRGDSYTEQRAAGQPGAVRREHEVRRPVPQVHLVGDASEPAHWSPRKPPPEDATRGLDQSPQDHARREGVEEEPVAPVEEVVDPRRIAGEPRRDHEDQ